MFNVEIWLTFTIACLALNISPGPGSLLAIGKGISQGKVAAIVVALSIGAATLLHVLAAAFGLTLLIQTSGQAFLVVKSVGAIYLIWVGLKIILKRNLVSFEKQEKQSLRAIFATGFLTAALNPRVGIFVLAFIPQFIDAQAGSFTFQMIVYGIWFTLLSVLVLSLMGTFSTRLSRWLEDRPNYVVGLNVGAGLTFFYFLGFLWRQWAYDGKY